MSTLENGARTLRLHVWGASTTLPTLDPSSLYAASLLRATFARHESVHLQLASASTSLSRVPLLQVLDDDSSTTIELIDSVEAIRAFCIATGGLDLELASDAELSAKQTALHALMDDQLQIQPACRNICIAKKDRTEACDTRSSSTVTETQASTTTTESRC